MRNFGSIIITTKLDKIILKYFHPLNLFNKHVSKQYNLNS